MEAEPAEIDDDLYGEVLPQGAELLGGQYVIERYLSSGGFGITYLARDSLDRRVVIKECFPEAFCSRKNRTVVARTRSQQHEFQSFVDMFVREARSIAKLNHPNIVGVHQVFQDNETAYMALDLIDGTDLLDIIEARHERPSYAKAKSHLLKLLDAISTVHAEDMLHRDISPDNILIDAWQNPILIDFGAAREEASKKSRALSAVLVVKDGYSPQEFYISGSKQTASSDLYALAATFYHLIAGEMPPDSQTRLAAIASRKADPYQPLVGRIPEYPDGFLGAIDLCMSVFPQDRLQTAQEWVEQIDESKRTKAALERAHSDQSIERTITQLVQAAQSDPVEAPAKPQPAVRKAATIAPPQPQAAQIGEGSATDWAVAAKIKARRTEPAPPRWEPKEQPKRYLKLQDPNAGQPKAGRPKSRIAARLVLSASFCFLAVGGQAKPIAEALAPFVLQVVSSAEKFIAGMG